MFVIKCALLMGFLTLYLRPITGKANVPGGPSYLKSGELSGGGASGGHSYPKSGGLSGGGSGGHSYPKSGGLSGGSGPGGYSYPKSSGGIRNLPSGGRHSPNISHGYALGRVTNSSYSYPTSVSNHSYPPTTGVPTYSPVSKSQSYSAPGSSSGYPTNVRVHSYPSSTNKYHYSSFASTTNKPPSKLRYSSTTVKYSYSSPGSSANFLNRKIADNPKNIRSSAAGTSNSPHVNKHSYSNSGRGSSSGGHGSIVQKPNNSYKTNIYSNYYYKPPAKIIYKPSNGGSPINYPVYHGELPNYVYQYKDSGSKYSTLLAGLALMNLGNRGLGFAAHQANSNHDSSVYKPQPGEVCKFAIKKESGLYEEAFIDCQIISSFILEDIQAQKSRSNVIAEYTNPNAALGQAMHLPLNTPTMLPNDNFVNMVNTHSIAQYTATASQALWSSQNVMLPNGTIIEKTDFPVIYGGIANIPVHSSIMINTPPIMNALHVKGEPIKATSDLECYVIMLSPTWNMRKSLSCRLLETYADTSLHHNDASHNVPAITVLAAFVVYGIA